MPPKYQENLYWRCMGGKLWACDVGANLPCDSKADTSREPNAEMREFCRENKGEDMPAAVTGHETIYGWKCNTKGLPVIVGRLFKVDARGFQTDFWTEIRRVK